jgi:penicillin-binding protein 4B
MWRKRAIITVCLFIACLALLVGRLMQLQLFETEHFSKHQINLLEESVAQRSQEIVIDSGRGGFLDRNGESLTHQSIPVLILFPFLKKTEWDVQKVANTIGVSTNALTQAVNKAKGPFAYGTPDPMRLTAQQMEAINKFKIPGVFAVEKKFDLQKNPAEHLIGIIGENEKVLKSRYPDKKMSEKTSIGLTGMEKSFDEFLLPEGEAKLVYHVDASGGPLFGINVKYVEPANPFYPINIRSTIDSELQKKAEELVDKHGIKNGGLVLIDIETNSVLSMVSRPGINYSDPFNKKKGEIQNLMLKQQIIGSVFKTVVAAAAIENKLDGSTRVFDCSRKINGDPDPKYQHGNLNFTESFARSCNNTFASLAKELKDIDPNILEEYAKKLALIGPSGWEGSIYHYENFRQLPDEDNGRVFLSEEAKNDRNFVALTGIGQHEVRVTPLAMANMMATIARGGEKEMVRIASSIEYKNGASLLSFKEKELDGDTITSYTATRLQRLLREVVTNSEGTGRLFQALPYEVAGKSGTSETGKYTGDQQLHNKWFTGYFPYQNPKYALVVVNLDVLANEGGVNPLFADMVKMIYKFDQNNEE